MRRDKYNKHYRLRSKSENPKLEVLAPHIPWFIPHLLFLASDNAQLTVEACREY